MAGEISFIPSEADYVAANRDWIRRAMFTRRTLALTLIAVVVLAALGGSMASQAGDEAGPIMTAAGFGLLGAVTMTACFGLSYFTMPRRARRLYRQQKSLRQPLHFGWSEAGLSYRSSNGAGSFAWSDFYRWSDGRDMFLFYLNEQLFYFLPHRALTDAEQQDLRAVATTLGPPRF